MIWSEIAVAVLLVAGLIVWFALVNARRLDRLHRKVVASRLALDSQLLRRASSAQDLASSGVFDPVSSVLLAESARTVLLEAADGDSELAVAVPDLSELVAAHRTVTAHGGASRIGVLQALDAGLGAQRESHESELTAVITELLESPEESAQLYTAPEAAALLDNLSGAWYRVQLARRFHNESVLQAQRVRAKGWVRLFRLAGYAPMPHTVEFDDTWPAGLKQPRANVAATTSSVSAEPETSTTRSVS